MLEIIEVQAKKPLQFLTYAICKEVVKLEDVVVQWESGRKLHLSLEENSMSLGVRRHHNRLWTKCHIFSRRLLVNHLCHHHTCFNLLAPTWLKNISISCLSHSRTCYSVKLHGCLIGCHRVFLKGVAGSNQCNLSSTTCSKWTPSAFENASNVSRNKAPWRGDWRGDCWPKHKTYVHCLLKEMMVEFTVQCSAAAADLKWILLSRYWRLQQHIIHS